MLFLKSVATRTILILALVRLITVTNNFLINTIHSYDFGAQHAFSVCQQFTIHGIRYPFFEKRTSFFNCSIHCIESHIFQIIFFLFCWLNILVNTKRRKFMKINFKLKQLFERMPKRWMTLARDLCELMKPPRWGFTWVAVMYLTFPFCKTSEIKIFRGFTNNRFKLYFEFPSIHVHSRTSMELSFEELYEE